MKLSSLTIIGFFCSLFSFGQAGEWTWISGDNVPNGVPVFGTQGVPSVSNNPGAIYGPMQWKDKQGNFWLYGGWNYYSDLWKFNPSTLEWTWVKGSGLTYEPAVYGTKGVPDPANTPGSRDWIGVSWVDTSGNFWMFGGNVQNDLWRFNLSTNEWTWMSGEMSPGIPGNHGIQGVPSTLNCPGPRKETCTGWTDASNNLWLFGGEGLNDAGQSGILNDLMKYDISTNEWTWVSGTDNVATLSNYGTKGVTSATNMPGGRWSYTKWMDAQGNFWLLGGWSYTVSDNLNDLWKYDPSINQWTWMAGTNLSNDPGTYINTCVYDSVNMPSARMEHSANATDDCGRFWLFGGCMDWFSSTHLNDLWIFDPQQNYWNWISGTNIPNAVGNYGTLGVSSPANMPPARLGAKAWWGDDDRFYLFGGYQINAGTFYGDVWVYTPDTSCMHACLTVPSALFNAPNHICPGTCTDFTNLSTGSNSFLWSFPGGNPSVSTDASPTGICYNTPGNYSVTLIASNGVTSDTLTLNNFIHVYPQPAPQGIMQSGDTLFANAGATSYQWYYNGNIINGATDYYCVATQSGSYNVVATDENDCEVEAVINDVLAHTPLAAGYWPLAVYPNPVTSTINIRGLENNTADEISIYNVIGEKVFSAVDWKLATINCQHFPKGIYYLELLSNKKIYRLKFVKM